MTAPTKPACRCRHGALAHELDGLAPQCAHSGCDCLEYKPPVPATVRRVNGAHTPPSPLPVKFQPADEDLELKETAEKLNSTPPNSTKPAASPVEAAMIAVDVLLADAKTRTPRIRRLAEKVEAELKQLQDLVAADAESAAARKEIAELEARLRKARAKLAVKKTSQTLKPAPVKAAPEPTDAGHQCPDCDKKSPTTQGLAAHRRHAHGYRKAEAS